MVTTDFIPSAHMRELDEALMGKLFEALQRAVEPINGLSLVFNPNEFEYPRLIWADDLQGYCTIMYGLFNDAQMAEESLQGFLSLQYHTPVLTSPISHYILLDLSNLTAYQIRDTTFMVALILAAMKSHHQHFIQSRI